MIEAPDWALQTIYDLEHGIEQLEAENARLLAAASPPDGWVFYSADFSMPASGLGPVGNVMFKRDIEGTKSWHALPDEQKEDEDGPPLYVSGRGASLYEALCDACCAIRSLNPNSAGGE